LFITFEGSEGTGKTSQLASLVAYLRGEGYAVLTPREPGGTVIGEQVRPILFDHGNENMDSRTEVLLFQASRAQLVTEVIRPALEAGQIVLCDRYADSTLAYQGYGRQLDLAQLGALIDFATGGLKPDLTVLLDVPVEVGLKRREKEGNRNRLDVLDLAFYRRVRQGYLEMARREPGRWALIDADRPFGAVQESIRSVVLGCLNARNANLG
jgi:dTMP kinase